MVFTVPSAPPWVPDRSPASRSCGSGRGFRCLSVRGDGGLVLTAPHRGYRIESGKSVVVVGGVAVDVEGGWWRGSAPLVHAPPWVPDRVRRIGCGSWRCGRYDVGCVGVSPSPQPSPAGRGGKIGQRIGSGESVVVVGGVAGTTLGVSAFLPHPNPLPLGEGARVGSGSGPVKSVVVVGGVAGTTLGVSAFLPHPNPLPLGEGARVGSGSGPVSRLW